MAKDEDDILLKLVIQGQSPDEIRRLAQQTQGALNAEMAQKLTELSNLHKQLNENITKEQKKRVETEIKEEQKSLDAVSKIYKARQDAAERGVQAAIKAIKEEQSQLAKTLSMAADGVIAFQGFWGAVSGGLGRAKALGDEIDKVTNVYGSLKGSIDEMRDSTRGEVSDIDLIITKNRALEKELNLTDKQFGAVAAAADNFADATGTNTKEALDKLVDGLAQGRLKTLAAAGVVIDATAAYAAYAKSIGTSSDMLNDHGKKMAIIQAGLDKLAEKQRKAGDGVDDFSHKWEKMTAEINNTTDSLKLFVGMLAIDVYDGLTKGLPFAFASGAAKIKDIITGGAFGFEKALLDKIGHEGDQEEMLAKLSKQGKNFRRYGQDINPDDFLRPGGKYAGAGDARDSIDSAKAAAAAKRADDERRKQEEFNQKYELFLRGGKGAEVSGLDVPMLGEDQRSHDLDTAFDSTGSRRAAPGGLSGGLARQAALQKAFAGKDQRDSEDVDRQQAQAAEAMAKVNEDAMTEMLDKADKLRERAGNGIFATLLFGPSGREELLDDIDSFKNSAADAMGMVSDTAMKMAEALGASLAAFVSGDKNKRKSIRDTTHDILEALSAQAYTRAIFETAEGLASLALGPIGGVSAGMHFAAAGMFGAVGTAAGLAARGVGQSAQAGAGARGVGAGSTAGGGPGYSSGSTGGGSSFGSGGIRSSDNGGSGGGGNLTVVINAPLGDRADIGRGLNLALADYFARTGRGVPLAVGAT